MITKFNKYINESIRNKMVNTMTDNDVVESLLDELTNIAKLAYDANDDYYNEAFEGENYDKAYDYLQSKSEDIIKILKKYNYDIDPVYIISELIPEL